MNAPDYSHGYLRVPLSVWGELYCRTPLTRRQVQIVSVVIRESWGWQTRGGQVYLWTRPLSPWQFAEATGLATDHLARDLRTLVARGVLLEQAGRYQLVPDPPQWADHQEPMSNARWRAPKPRGDSAERALSTPDLKKAKKKKRNVPPLPEQQLSPAVDKSQAPGRDQPFAEDTSSEVRFVDAVSEFVGGLPAGQREQLQHWLAADGAAVVWEALAEAFRLGPESVRRCLAVRFAGNGQAPGTDKRPESEATDA